MFKKMLITILIGFGLLWIGDAVGLDARGDCGRGLGIGPVPAGYSCQQGCSAR
ncbi:hypothetical protein [Dictyobacter kobayashii]|uniref:hypothetical protein n=1 Tax=Dictyobacter kobayashii TaxID=2014872 RepID=UPI001386BD14|nr:hypothetical protein [Dictyobacter kobayashii]